MSHIEDIFGNDPIELVIKIHSRTIEKFSRDSPIISFEEMKRYLSEDELDCCFQNIGEGKHKIFIPIESLGIQVEIIVSWHDTSFSYKAISKDKYRITVKKPIKLPEDDSITESCTVHLIDISEPYRTKEELEHLYNRVSNLEVIAGVDIDKENEIWFKYIDATKRIIEKRQEPFGIRKYYPLLPIKGSDRFSFKVDLEIEENKEYKEVEAKLRELDVETPNFDREGNIFLTINDIFNGLDLVIKKEFNEIIARQKNIDCRIKIKPATLLENIRKVIKRKGVFIKTSWNYKEKEIYFYENTKLKIGEINKILNEIEDEFKLESKAIDGKIEIFDDSKGVDAKYYSHNWTKKEIANRNALNDRTAIFKNYVFNDRNKLFRKGIKSYPPQFVKVYTFNPENYSDQIAGEELIGIKRLLYSLSFNVNLISSSNSILFSFVDENDLRDKIDELRNLEGFNLFYYPEGFKYKVKTTIISRKTHLEILRNRIEKLGGVDFNIILPRQNKDTGEWFFTDEERPDKLLIGSLNRRESNISSLEFILNPYFQEHKEALKKINLLIEEQAPIKFVYPNLAGDAAKMSWLKGAVDKLTNPSEKANGKPVNPNLKEFIFDSSKAEPIYDDNKITENSTFWNDVANTKLSKNLNSSQIKAILSAIHSKDLCLLQGPPGTGKTTVISEIIWQEVRQNSNNSNGVRILLTSETNLAVDNALEKLVGINTTIVKPLRFGKSAKFEEEGKKYSSDRILKWVDEKYDTKNEQLDSEEEGEDNLKEDLSNNAVQRWMLSIGNRAQRRAKPKPKYTEVLKDWHKDLALPSNEIKEIFVKKYFKYANVIGSTCSSCGSPRFKRDYNTIFNPNFDGRAIKEILFLIDNKPSSYKIWNLLEDELGIDIRGLNQSHFPSIKQDLNEKSNIKFDTVIMDEASKATPPEMLLPLCFGKKSIIIGDHKQLPPMINDREFKEVLIEEAEDEKLANEIGDNYLKESQFKRLISNPRVSHTIKATFDEQYRMHSQIGLLIQQFYPELPNGLICGIKEYEDIEDFNHPASRYHGYYHEGFIKPHSHVIWVDVPEPESKDGTSRINEAECETIKQVLNYLKHSEGYDTFHNHWNAIKDEDKRLQEQEVGIISFYGKQVNKLKEIKKYSEKELSIPIRLKTVDKFQGMERNIIIVSTVRSNTITNIGTEEPVPNVRGREGRNYSPWGFADSPERLNVALSRAKRLLIIVGNKSHFENFKNKEGIAIYKNVISQIRSSDIIDYRTLSKYK